MAPSAKHPEPDRLKAFALGRLSSAEMDRVEAHVAACAACGAIALAAPADGLVALLRRAPGSRPVSAPAH